MHIFIFVAVASIATPTELLDHVWGKLTRSRQLHGRWQVALDDGTRFYGDWIIVYDEPNRTSKSAFFVDSSSSSTCYIYDVQKPSYVHCTGGHIEARVISALVLTRGKTTLTHGAIDVDVAPKLPSLGQELMLFERVYGRSLASQFKTAVRTDGGTVVFEYPYIDRELPKVKRDSVCPTLDSAPPVLQQEVIEAVATIRIGPSPHHVAITARETTRYIEPCTYRTRLTRDNSCTAPIPGCGAYR